MVVEENKALEFRLNFKGETGYTSYFSRCPECDVRTRFDLTRSDEMGRWYMCKECGTELTRFWMEQLESKYMRAVYKSAVKKIATLMQGRLP